jgi:hypothetical protein
MIAWFAGVVWYVNVHLGLPVALRPTMLTPAFLRFCQSMVLLAAVMGIVFEPRRSAFTSAPAERWEPFCGAAKRSPVALTYEAAWGVVPARRRVTCRIGSWNAFERGGGEKSKGRDSGTLPVSSSCFAVSAALPPAPAGIRLNEPKRREEHGDGEKKTFSPGRDSMSPMLR